MNLRNAGEGVVWGIVLFIFAFPLVQKVALTYASKKLPASSPAAVNLITPTPISYPVRISIPSINVSTNIEKVGLDNQGRIDVPQDTKNTGWYMYGPIPGQQGRAVIDGHYDDPNGPSTFYHLANLRPDDKIIITDSSQKVVTFLVTSVQTYPDNQFPLEEIFNPSSSGTSLILITCAGIYNRQDHNYSHRLVVYADKST